MSVTQHYNVIAPRHPLNCNRARRSSEVHPVCLSSYRRATCGSGLGWARALRRSEEHTSELQSQSNLVCRLLLEKKNGDLLFEHHRPYQTVRLVAADDRRM